MPKKKLSDMVFQQIEPPDYQTEITNKDMAKVLVRRLGLKRKESRADHAKLLLELLRYKKEDTPMDITQISKILGVSISQCYEEMRKWRTLGIIEFVKTPIANDYIKGYMLTANTVNKLIDKAESATKSFFRKTRRIAKDFDDSFQLSAAREEKQIREKIREEVKEPVLDRIKSTAEEIKNRPKEEIALDDKQATEPAKEQPKKKLKKKIKKPEESTDTPIEDDVPKKKLKKKIKNIGSSDKLFSEK